MSMMIIDDVCRLGHLQQLLIFFDGGNYVKCPKYEALI
jgi:hypothetical protein